MQWVSYISAHARTFVYIFKVRSCIPIHKIVELDLADADEGADLHIGFKEIRDIHDTIEVSIFLHHILNM